MKKKAQDKLAAKSAPAVEEAPVVETVVEAVVEAVVETPTEEVAPE